MQNNNKIKPTSPSGLFLAVVLIHLSVSIFLTIISDRFAIPIVPELILSELIILIPGLVWILNKNVSFRAELSFRPLKAGTIFMSILLAYLLMPLVSLINLISQLFTKNEVLQISDEVTGCNFFAVLFIIGFFGPFCEEFVFRGIIFNSMNRFAGGIAAALMSGLMFGLLHMNLNQFLYAFFLGVIFSAVNYASKSLYTSVIMHTVINSHNVILLYMETFLFDKLGLDMQSVADSYTTDSLLMAIALFLLPALIASLIAIPVMNYIAVHEGNEGAYINFLKEKPSFDHPIQDKAKSLTWCINIFSIPALLICLIMIFWNF